MDPAALVWFAATVALLGYIAGVFTGFSLRVRITYHVWDEDPDALAEDEPIPYQPTDDTGSWRNN